MNLLKIAIDRIKFGGIPNALLKEAFSSVTYNPTSRQFLSGQRTNISLDQMIEDVVIRDRVKVDLDLCSGIETTLDISQHIAEYIDDYNCIYRLDEQLLGGRILTNVIEILYGDGNLRRIDDSRGCGASVMTGSAEGVLNVHLPIPKVSSARVSIIEHNTILVADTMRIPYRLYLKCQVAHEKSMNDLNPAYANVFFELVRLATQAYVYNKLVINVDEGVVRSGVEIGRYREKLDEYSDSFAMYNEFLNTEWKQVALMNNKEAYDTIKLLAVGGGW